MTLHITDACPIHGNLPRPSVCHECARYWGNTPASLPAPDWRDAGRYLRTERAHGLGLRVVFEPQPVSPPAEPDMPWTSQGAAATSSAARGLAGVRRAGAA